MILSTSLQERHIIEETFPLSEEVIQFLQDKNWKALDQYFLNASIPGGVLFEFLRPYLEFKSIEHIIAIRSAPDDEDGIWHDDGSRILGFSLSLTENHAEVIGGQLKFKPKGNHPEMSITTRPMGQILLFKTGIYGFEHMVSAVTKGQRIVIAGWCS